MEQIKENKMGVMPVNKLLLSMSLPMMLSMLVQALYNIVDSVFVARISEDALTAVSLAFPVQNLMLAIIIGTSVGVNALLSRSLGAKDFDEANRAANNGMFLALICFAIFLCAGLSGARLFFEVQTSKPEIIKYGYEYLSVICVYSFGFFMSIMLDKLLQSTGKTFCSMLVQLSGAVTNLIFDPIMIFGLLGCPKLGVSGAAIATVMGQFVSMFMALFLNIKYNREIRLRIKGFKPNGATIRRVLEVGIPTTLMQSIGSVMTFGMNRILLAFSTTAAAVFGIYFKLQSFVFMPVFGLNNGMVPIISYNYGARRKERIVQTMTYSIIYAVSIMLAGMAAFNFLPAQLLRLFDASPSMIEIGVPALSRISYSFFFAGYCIICGSVFQALGNGIFSLIVSAVRQLVVLLPTAYLLSLTGNLNAIWYSFIIAELFSLTLSTLFLRHMFKTRIDPLSEPQKAAA